MKKEINKSKNKKVVKKEELKSNIKTDTKQHKSICTRLKLKKGMGINICIGLCILIFIVLFIFIILGVVKYFNNKIDNKNKKFVEEYTSENKKICFDEECFYIIDYSIDDRCVYLITEKNISLDEKSIQKDDSSSLERKDIDKYLGYYKNTLEDKNVEVLDISIPTKDQLEKNGCSFKQNSSNIYTCSEDNSWIYSTSYYYDGNVSGVVVNIDGLDSHFIFPFDMNEQELDNLYGRGKTLKIGLRAVIKVSFNEIS